jgi:excisionase family DNA binding protein
MLNAELATRAADPARIDAVPAAQLPDLLGAAEALRARLLARLMTLATAPAAPAANGNGKPDRLLSIDEAAERLGVSRRWVYRHADTLDFTRRLTATGPLRFSERGLERWKESKR